MFCFRFAKKNECLCVAIEDLHFRKFFFTEEEEEFYSWSKRKRDEITREILVTIVSRDNIDRGLERN